MTQEQFDVRPKRAAEELFVISTTDDGWRVRSAHNPSQHYLVSGDGEGLRCDCPDFETHVADDANWSCKHILAELSEERLSEERRPGKESWQAKARNLRGRGTRCHSAGARTAA